MVEPSRDAEGQAWGVGGNLEVDARDSGGRGGQFHSSRCSQINPTSCTKLLPLWVKEKTGIGKLSVDVQSSCRELSCWFEICCPRYDACLLILNPPGRCVSDSHRMSQMRCLVEHDVM